MQRFAPGLTDDHFRKPPMVRGDTDTSRPMRHGILPLAIVAFALVTMLILFAPTAQAQTPSDPPGVEEGITAPPDLDAAERGDPVAEEDEADEEEDTRPANLPDGVDAGQRGDPVAEEDEGSGKEDTRPANLPAGVDAGQRGDPVAGEEAGGATGASQAHGDRPAGLPDGVDTAQRGDPVAEEDEADEEEDTRPANLPDGVDAGQRDDPVEEGGASGQAATAPAPTGLSVTASDEDSVTLSWTAVTDADAYRVEYKASTSSTWLIDGYVYNGTAQSVDRLACSTAYDFQVRARGDGDPYSYTYSSPSGSVSRTTSQCLAPAPTGLSVTASDEDSVTLSWTGVTDAGAYRVEYKTSTSSTWLVDEYVYSRTSQTVDSLACGTAYQFQVRARGDGDPFSFTYGLPSGSVSRTTSLCLAPAPTGLSVTASDEDSVTLSWTGVTDADAYRVEYKASTSSTWLIDDHVYSGTSHMVDGLACSTAHDFQVRARGDEDPYSYTYGSPSGSVSRTTSTCLAPAPTGLSVTASDEDSVTLSWTGVTDAGAYRVEYKTSTSSTWLIDDHVYSGTSETVDGLACDTAYQFQVRARGDGNPYSYTYGSPSGSASRTTDRCRAPAPTGLSVTASDEYSVTLRWTAVTDAGAYRVEYRTSTSSTWLVDEYVYSGTSQTVYNLACGTAYDFQIRARGDGDPYSLLYGSPLDQRFEDDRLVPCASARGLRIHFHGAVCSEPALGPRG